MFTVMYEKTKRDQWKALQGQFYSLQDAVTLATHLAQIVHRVVVQDTDGKMAYDAWSGTYYNGY